MTTEERRRIWEEASKWRWIGARQQEVLEVVRSALRGPTVIDVEWANIHHRDTEAQMRTEETDNRVIENQTAKPNAGPSTPAQGAFARDDSASCTRGGSAVYARLDPFLGQFGIRTGLVRGGRVERELAERGYSSRVMCNVVKPDGRRCRFPALEGRTLCEPHARWEVEAGSWGLPYPDDAVALHQFMSKALAMTVSKQLDARQAGAVVNLCKVMLRNVAWVERQIGMAEMEFFE
jgi:hypothetical protein